MIAGVLGKTPNGEITEEQMLLKLFVFLLVSGVSRYLQSIRTHQTTDSNLQTTPGVCLGTNLQAS